MKNVYLLFVAVILAACSAEPVENDVLSGVDANLEGKSNNVTTQDVGEEFIIPDLLCAGEEAEFCMTFPQKTKGNGDPQTTGVQVQLFDEVDNEWYPIIKGEGNTEVCFTYTFLEAKDYRVRHFIGGGGHTESSVTVTDCQESETECPSGYMFGDKNFSEIGTSNNWGWAHEFNMEDGESETRKIHHKNGSLGGDVTISYNEGNVTITEGDGVTISHIYVSNDEPTETNAPGQFDKTQKFIDEDGDFWVMIKAEVCD